MSSIRVRYHFRNHRGVRAHLRNRPVIPRLGIHKKRWVLDPQELEFTRFNSFDEGGFEPKDWDVGRLEWKTPEALLGGSHGPISPKDMTLQIVGMGYNTDPDETEAVDRLRDRIRHGLPIDPAAQAFTPRGEELFNGLHRAVAAKLEGVRVPVWVFYLKGHTAQSVHEAWRK